MVLVECNCKKKKSRSTGQELLIHRGMISYLIFENLKHTQLADLGEVEGWLDTAFPHSSHSIYKYILKPSMPITVLTLPEMKVKDRSCLKLSGGDKQLHNDHNSGCACLIEECSRAKGAQGHRVQPPSQSSVWNLSSSSYLMSELVPVTGPQVHLQRKFKVSHDCGDLCLWGEVGVGGCSQ